MRTQGNAITRYVLKHPGLAPFSLASLVRVLRVNLPFQPLRQIPWRTGYTRCRGVSRHGNVFAGILLSPALTATSAIPPVSEAKTAPKPTQETC